MRLGWGRIRRTLGGRSTPSARRRGKDPWEVESRLDRIIAEMHVTRAMMLAEVADQHETLAELHEGVSVDMRAEFDRLDAFVAYHSEVLTRRIDSLQDDMRAEFERLDASVASRSEALARRIDSLQSAVDLTRMVPVMKDLDVLVTTGVGDLIIPSHEVGLLAFLGRHGTDDYELGVRSLMANTLGSGDTVVDVGANVGVMTLTALNHVAPGGRVISFEPSPDIARVLARTIDLNGYGDSCDVHQHAIGASVGEMSLVISDHSPLSHRVREDSEPSEATIVTQSTLDEMIDPELRVALVKVDVEGDEAAVWRGSRLFRERNPSAGFVLEWSVSNAGAANESLEALRDEIEADGYLIGVIEDTGGLGPLVADATSWEGLNVFVARRIADVRRPPGFADLPEPG